MTALRDLWNPAGQPQPDPRLAGLGEILAAVGAHRPPVPWSAIRALDRALKPCDMKRPVTDPASLVDAALAAAGKDASKADRAIMVWALTDSLKLHTMHVDAPGTMLPRPATGPDPRPLSPAQIQARRQLQAYGEALAIQGHDPVPLQWKVAVLGLLRAGYGSESGLGLDDWHGFSRDVVARALWNIPANRLPSDEGAAFAQLVSCYGPNTPGSVEGRE